MTNKSNDVFLPWIEFKVYLATGIVFKEISDAKHDILHLNTSVGNSGYRTMLFGANCKAKGQPPMAAADHADYIANFQVKSNQPPLNIMPNGTQAVSVRDEKYSDLTSRIIGNGHMQIPPNSTGILDFRITKELKIRGGDFWCLNATFGDTVDFEIVDKDDVLGLFSQYGLTAGVDIISLSKPIDTISIPPFPQWTYGIAMGTEQDIKEGLFIRLKYVNQGVANTVQCGLAILVRE